MQDAQGDARVGQHRRSIFSASLEQTLRASDEILELLPIATCVCDSGGSIVQYNQRAVELWGRAPDPGQTHDQFTAQCKFISGEGEELPRSKLAEVLQTGRSIRNEEVTVRRIDGSEIVVLLNIDPLIDGQGRMVGAINCFQDVTERRRMMDALDRNQHELREQEERWSATYEHAAIGIVELDAEGRFIRVNEAICSIVGGTREELLNWRLQGRTHPDDRDVDEDLYRRQVAGDIGFYSIEKRFIRRDGRVIWMGIRSSTVRDATGHFLHGVRVVQDITERKEAEDRQKLLIDELNHRVKNTLATVQSLATQTARCSSSPEQFCNAFEGRLIALSQAHDQLTRRHWKSADLRDIVEGATSPHIARSPESQDRIVIDGEPITVTPRVALTLALGLHELTTNAAKYGALSEAAGRIEVNWRIVDQLPAAPILRIEWRERGGPQVAVPARQGFGTRFIEGSVASELRGKARLDYAADGLMCTMDIPLDSVMPDADGSLAL
ncbi:MAG: PAS domain S-box protein [Alphaproteobacteria bacterium]|nr:PAS domain S-box protein [Alphaproteobacteria bacterium]